MKPCHALYLLAAAAALLPLSGGPSDTVTIQGAGATFPAPLYKRWFLEFYKAHPNVRVNYQAIGSCALYEMMAAYWGQIRSGIRLLSTLEAAISHRLHFVGQEGSLPTRDSASSADTGERPAPFSPCHTRSLPLS